jgi:cytochrome c biogenesis protein CcdA
MHFGVGSIGIGFTAGVLSILSPCVLPLLPLVLTPAATERRAGVLALGAGLVASFVSAGLFVATIGLRLGWTAAYSGPHPPFSWRASGLCCWSRPKP